MSDFITELSSRVARAPNGASGYRKLRFKDYAGRTCTVLASSRLISELRRHFWVETLNGTTFPARGHNDDVLAYIRENTQTIETKSDLAQFVRVDLSTAMMKVLDKQGIYA
jgi:hypothetical protein